MPNSTSPEVTLLAKPLEARRHPKKGRFEDTPNARRRHAMLKVAAALVAGVVAMGGWAVVTVKDLPEYFVAGQQYTIEFQVRQHGRTLLSGLRPQLVIESPGARQVIIPAVARAADGTYAVTFTAPPPADGERRFAIS